MHSLRSLMLLLTLQANRSEVYKSIETNRVELVKTKKLHRNLGLLRQTERVWNGTILLTNLHIQLDTTTLV